MGALDLQYEKEYLKFITGSLARRGLRPTIKGDWEVHGPHKGMPYMVFVGTAYGKSTGSEYMIAVYPNAVYRLKEGDPSEWWNVDNENKITIC